MVCKLFHGLRVCGRGPNNDLLEIIIAALGLGIVLLFAFSSHGAFAAVTHLPGDDASDKMQAAGTLIKILDTGLFKWGARLFAGICILSAAWSLKEQRFGTAIICVIGAIIFGTAPMWVKNIFEIGGGDSLFSMNVPLTLRYLIAQFPGGGFYV